MNRDELYRILTTDGSLCNARRYKDAESAANHITQHYSHVTQKEVAAVMVNMQIHPGTGAVIG